MTEFTFTELVSTFNKYSFKNSNEFDIFNEFRIKENWEPLVNFANKFINKEIKCQRKSEQSRLKGNEYYKRGRNNESIAAYTQSLSYALYNSKEYGLALANRSAVAFKMENYKHCLNDIELCLKSEYPHTLRPKICLRQAECYYNLKMYSKMKTAIALLEGINEKMIKDKVEKLKLCDNEKFFWGIQITLPILDESPNFMSASSKIRVQCNDLKGRHVVAAEDLKPGDLLFVEKAFFSVPIYNEDGTLPKEKCLYCFKDCKYLIFCKTCDFSYCNEQCRDLSYQDHHKYECAGRNLWYEIGIGFPAWRCLLKGIPSNFEFQTTDPKHCEQQYGDATNNYQYVNSLLHNLDLMSHVTPLLATVSIIMIYIEKHTNIVDDALVNFAGDRDELVKRIGGLLLRHIGHITSNGSLVMHWDSYAEISANENTIFRIKPKLGSEKTEDVSTGIYPSVSMMNHSCDTNVGMYYIQDYVVVKAIKYIKTGEEIFNCYGYDYKVINREERLSSLRNHHYFDCMCQICAEPKMEFDNLFNYYTCPACRNKVFENNSVHECITCKKAIKDDLYQRILEECYLHIDQCEDVERVTQCLKKCEKYLSETHDCLYELIYKLYILCKTEGHSMAEYYGLRILKRLEITNGRYSKRYGLTESEVFNDGMSNDAVKMHFPISELRFVEL